MDFVVIAAGLVFLIAGAEALVRGSSALARMAGISPLIIGLTVVAFGTSSPELAVSLKAAWSRQPDLAVGNVVGSNMFNVLFILGLSALITPLSVNRQLIRLDVPVMIGVSALMWLAACNGFIGRLEAGGFLLLGVAYTGFLVLEARKEKAADDAPSPDSEEPGANGRAAAFQVFLILAGLAALVLGSRWLVEGATVLARRLGISELVIGITIVAAGTSLPEVAASVAAAVKGERDLAVGNVVGSNIFNILFVLGSAGAVSGGVAVSGSAVAIDVPIMAAAALICLPVFFSGSVISRGEGALFLACYLAYVIQLILSAGSHRLADEYTAVVWWIGAPATLVLIALPFIRARRRKN